ncbi:MAG: hypothetical protein ACLGG0_05845 [Bacteriovoracia bacterium]
MQISVVLLLLIFSLSAFSSEDEIRDLMERYETHMSGVKTKGYDIFTADFAKESPDVAAPRIIEPDEEFKKKKEKLKIEHKIRMSKRNKDLAFVRRIEDGEQVDSEFVIKKIKGQWQIQGTINDED